MKVPSMVSILRATWRPDAVGPASLTLGLMLTPGAVAAELRLPDVFSDGMVLQQASRVPIWGLADPGAQVIVRLGADGSEATATAGEDGAWRTDLTTPPAAGGLDAPGLELTVQSAGESKTIKDVAIGEVWLCSGQSNMEWTLDKFIGAARKRGNLPPEKTSLEPRGIRFFTVPRSIAIEPSFTAGGEWLEAAGDDALNCSASAYYFAQRLRDDLDVPIGLVVSSWGGTRAEAWTSGEIVSAFPDHAEALNRVRERGGKTGFTSDDLSRYWDSVDESAFFARRYREPSFDDSHWQTATIPATFSDIGLGQFNGVVWYRKKIDVPPSWEGADLVLQLPPLDDLDETFWNGERIGSRVDNGAWRDARQYTVPGTLVSAGDAWVAVRVFDTGGRGGIAPGDMRLWKGDEWIDLAGEWRFRQSVSDASAPRPQAAAELGRHTPSALFNGMIGPIMPYGVQGIIWYQGESNRYRADEYRQLFPAMIVDWRTRWNDLNLPFYFVQIAPYNYNEGEENAERTAIVREGQALATRLPATGMVVTADIGNPRDIHPKNKWEVGRRLALFALRDVYGAEGVEPEAPTLKDASASSGKVTLTFDHVGDGLEAIGEGLQHFEVRSSDGRWVPASATLSADRMNIVLSSDDAPRPAGARYLWSDAAEASVRATSGLPLAPFRRMKLNR